jgi:hypothetical protein
MKKAFFVEAGAGPGGDKQLPHKLRSFPKKPSLKKILSF